jgi:hypothetical protein
LLEKVSDVVGDYLFSPTKEGLEELRNGLGPEEDKIFCRFINTLLKLPEDTVSQLEKEQIKMVLPIGQDGKLHPIIKKREHHLTLFSQGPIDLSSAAPHFHSRYC